METEDIPFLEMTPDESESVARLEKDLDKEARANGREVAGVPKRDGSKQPRRRRPDTVRGSQDGATSVRNSTGAAKHGSSPHKGKKRSA